MNKMQDLPLCDLNEVKRTAKRTDSDISGCKFSGEYLESEDLSCLSFINCMFENCTLTDCDFERSSFVDVTFISCDLSIHHWTHPTSADVSSAPASSLAQSSRIAPFKV